MQKEFEAAVKVMSGLREQSHTYQLQNISFEVVIKIAKDNIYEGS